MTEENSWEASRSEKSNGQSKGHSKISEWLNPEPEVKEESSNKKYYILLALLLAAGLCWYYSEELTPYVSTLIEKIRYFKPRDDSSDISRNRYL